MRQTKTRMTSLAILSVATMLAAVTPSASNFAHAAMLAGWELTTNTSSNGLAATAVNAPATAASLSNNGGISSNTATYSYDTKGYVGGSQSNNVQAHLAVSSPTSVTDLIFSAFASNTGPGTISIDYKADGGSLVHLQNITIGTATAMAATNYDLNFGSLVINSSLDVYFSAANAVSANGGTLSSSGTFRLNNVGDVAGAANYMQFQGAAVPEPSTFLLSGLALLGFVGLSRAIRKAGE